MLIEPRNAKLKDGRPITLRSPQPSDAEALLAHLRTVFHESYRNMNYPADHFDQFPVEAEAKVLKEFAGSSGKFMLSAFDGNRIVGNLGLFGAGVEFLRHSAHIGMGIEKSYQGIGLGTQILSYAIEASKARGFHRLELKVRTFNQPGIRLYEKSGFQRVGLLKDAAFIDQKFHDEFYYQLIL